MCCILGLKGFAVVTCSIIVSLCNRTGEERRQQTLCDKCDNVLFENVSAKLHSPLNRSFCKRPENISLSEDNHKTHKK